MKNLSTESLIMQNKPPNFNEMKKTIKPTEQFILLKLKIILLYLFLLKLCYTVVYKIKYLLLKVCCSKKKSKNKTSKFVHKN